MEREDSKACVVAEVLQAYEEAMGVAVAEEVLNLVGDFLNAIWSVYERLIRRYQFRVERWPIGQQS